MIQTEANLGNIVNPIGQGWIRPNRATPFSPTLCVSEMEGVEIVI